MEGRCLDLPSMVCGSVVKQLRAVDVFALS